MNLNPPGSRRNRVFLSSDNILVLSHHDKADMNKEYSHKNDKRLQKPGHISVDLRIIVIMFLFDFFLSGAPLQRSLEDL